MIRDPSLNCHEGWHASVDLTCQDSLDIHNTRLKRYNQSFRSASFRTIEDKNKAEIRAQKEREEKKKIKSQRIAQLIRDPSLNCHEEWHAKICMTEQESLNIHNQRLLNGDRHSFRSKEYEFQSDQAADWKNKNLEIVEQFQKGLYLEIESLKKTDSYGIEDFSAWECEYLEKKLDEDQIVESVTRNKYRFFKRKDGLAYFFERIIAEKMGGIESWFEDWRTFKSTLDNGAWQNKSWREFILDLTYKIYRKYRITEPLDRFQHGGANEQGYVYFIRNEDIYKIGITKDHERRFKELQPDEVLYLIKSKSYRRTEKILHEFFDNERVNGSEYFRLNESQVSQVIEMMAELADC